MSTIKERYEAVQYEAMPFVQTHPIHLATLGQLHGLEPGDPRRCRYLEVGCANGVNLIAMACALPESEFIGIDLAEAPIAAGRQLAERLGLKNITLIAGDLLQYPLDDRPFDYIAAHGFYCWVPEVVQQFLWQLCEKLLAPQGIAYISYNTYPGCYLRRMLREMMLFHTRQVEEPETKVYQAKAFLQFLEQAQATNGEVVATIRHEIDQLLHHRSDSSIYHDDLSPLNTPLYFHQFLALAGQHGLQFLAEADYFEMCYLHLPEAVQKHLQMMEQADFLLKEQYLDFLKLRRFRESLVCRGTLQVQRPVTIDQIQKQLLTSRGQFMGEFKVGPSDDIMFGHDKGAKLTLNHPLSKLGLRLLGSTYPRHWKYAELCEQAKQQLQEAGYLCTAEDERLLGQSLLASYSVGLVSLHCMQPSMALSQSERPRTAPLILEQLKAGERLVTNLMHIPVNIETDFIAAFLQLCDGTRTREDLVDACVRIADSDKVPVSDRVDQALQKAVQLALFIE